MRRLGRARHEERADLLGRPETTTSSVTWSWLRRARCKGALVTFRGSTIEVPVNNGHYAWLVEHVPMEAMDAPVDFDWLP